MDTYISNYCGIRRAAKEEVIESYEHIDLHETEMRLKTMEELWDNFSNAHDYMMASGEEDIDTFYNFMEQTELLHLQAVTALLKRKNILEQEEKTKIEQQNVHVNVTMPTAQGMLRNTWGTFDGNLTKWLGFKGRFMAAVHNNDEISPVFKFVYLKNSLIDEAALALCDWQLTAENYIQTWDRLLQRYDKVYPLSQGALREFFQLPYLVGKPTVEGLQNMVTVSYSCLLQLKTLGLPVDHWDMIIVHALHERLYADTAREWMMCKATEFPTWTEMLDFLNKQVEAIANANSCIADSKATQRCIRKKTIICLVCDDDHHTFQCEQLLSLSLNARMNFILKRRLCFNCLKLGHSASRCGFKPCKRCRGAKHNSAICPMLEKKFKSQRTRPIRFKVECQVEVPYKRAKFLDTSNDCNNIFNKY